MVSCSRQRAGQPPRSRGAGDGSETGRRQDRFRFAVSDALSVAPSTLIGRVSKRVVDQGGALVLPFIEGYTRRDGTPVRRHWRAPAGTSRETALAIAIVAALFVFGGSPSTPTGGGAGPERLLTPRPTSGATYPVRFPGWGKPVSRPAPAVSYPIRWPGWDKPAPRPVPTVSYPIKWERDGGGR